MTEPSERPATPTAAAIRGLLGAAKRAAQRATTYWINAPASDYGADTVTS